MSPTVGHFKQLSEIPEPPAYLHSGAAFEESLYKANDLDHLSQAVQLILTLSHSAHLCCSVDFQGQAKA